MPPPAAPGAVAVRFDDAVANHLVAMLELLARALSSVALESSDGAAGARVDWQGFTRSWFDTELEAVAADLRAVAREAWRAAESVREDQAAATARQIQRNQEATSAAEAALALGRTGGLRPGPAAP